LELKGEDRAFVFELIDRLEEYEQKSAEPEKKEEGTVASLFTTAEANQ